MNRPGASGQTGATFALAAGLFAFWLLLSGKTDAFHLGAGVAAAIGVALGSRGAFRNEQAGALSRLQIRPGWLPYFLWLFGAILVSAIQVARAVLAPVLRVRPGIVRFRDGLPHAAARTVLAHSITLTPGTVTLDSEDGELTVHAFDGASGEELREPGHPLRVRVARLFPPG